MIISLRIAAVIAWIPFCATAGDLRLEELDTHIVTICHVDTLVINQGMVYSQVHGCMDDSIFRDDFESHLAVSREIDRGK